MLRAIRSLLIAALAAAAIPDGASATYCGNRITFVKGHQFTVIGLTADGRLVSFRECTPRKVRDLGPVTGLTGSDTALIGIDYRVQDGFLYGVGNGGGIYKFAGAPGVATLDSQLTKPLDGTLFGVDFNPAADRLRIISDTGQNLRHNLNDDTTADGDLPLKNGDAVALGVTGAGYTNNDLAMATGTTLFDVDTTLDQLSIQSPPNNGNLIPTGKLGVDSGATVGFDIYSVLDKTGTTFSNLGYAVFSVGGVPGLYRVNPLTGAAVLIGSTNAPLADIALPLDQ